MSGKANGAFYLTEYNCDDILSVLDPILPIVENMANVVSYSANIYKELQLNGIEPKVCFLRIEPDALQQC